MAALVASTAPVQRLQQLCQAPCLPRRQCRAGPTDVLLSAKRRHGNLKAQQREGMTVVAERKETHAAASTSTQDRSDSSKDSNDGSDSSSGNAQMLGVIGLVVGLVAIAGAGFVFKDQIRQFIDYFIVKVDQWGPLGYVAYAGVYTLLELVAVPAIPLTMTAGVIFGVVPGTIVVSAAATTAATLSFLIARYAARDKILELASGNDKFKAVDRAIGKQGFKVVTLLRLSPLLPLALSNYLYGLTSVDLGSYVAGSWLGMLPGTIAYVIAGDYGRTLLDGEGEFAGVAGWQVALGLGVTVLALGYIGKVAKKALDDAEAEGDIA